MKTLSAGATCVVSATVMSGFVQVAQTAVPADRMSAVQMTAYADSSRAINREEPAALKDEMM